MPNGVWYSSNGARITVCTDTAPTEPSYYEAFLK